MNSDGSGASVRPPDVSDDRPGRHRLRPRAGQSSGETRCRQARRGCPHFIRGFRLQFGVHFIRVNSRSSSVWMGPRECFNRHHPRETPAARR